ncbi:MAG: right-handed parallel beta-helix repeat-containing protein [Thermoplasmata archaeon]|nr:MAG: right-handed parallel beta-helix repeat-containing protein [Thermoplasmata archaeon]
MKKRISLVWIICLLLANGILVFLPLEPEVASARKIWYVGSGDGNDSATINGGITLADDGDTVFVHSGIYYENVMVYKTIDLIGEDRKTTIIDAGEVGSAIYVECDWVSITGFTVKGCGGTGYNGGGIKLYQAQNCTIYHNNASNNLHNGIFLEESLNNEIRDNIITWNDWDGIELFYSPYNRIINNSLSFNSRDAIRIWNSNLVDNKPASKNNIIKNNNVSNNPNRGIIIEGPPFPSCNKILNNIVISNEKGIALFDCFDNIVARNTVLYNDHGIRLSSSSSNNRVFHNQIISNTHQAFNWENNNFWDDGYPSGGNYWSDYTGIDINSGPNQDQPGSDGIGDTPYTAIEGPSGGQDNYPLMDPGGGYEPEFLPPELCITVSSNGNDVILYWDSPPSSPGTTYQIYRSTSQIGFNFNSPHDTAFQSPWTDSNAANPGQLNYEEQYYYVIRTRNMQGEMTRTSRTVGKWTRVFSQGVSSFSLPLEPIDTLYTDDLTSITNAEYIKYIDPITRTWRQHNFGDSALNNTEMKLGEAYEIKFSQQSKHTFTGLPGAMILYDDDIGFSGFDPDTDAQSLNISIESDGDVRLSWQAPTGMGTGDYYLVYCSNTRDGFFGDLNSGFSIVDSVGFGINTAMHEGARANDPGTRLYYMVLPVNATRVMGAGTYSVGIWTEKYLSQYDTIGIPLKLENNQTVDWYCDNIPDTVGINYFDHNGQRWAWHATRMPEGTYDTVLEMTEGYQISTSDTTKYIFIGI